MINQSKYIPKQMNGPVINAKMEALEDQLKDAKAIENYLYNLSIQSAQETELESIGCLIGYPRPLVPDGFNSENILILGTLPIETDEENGLATIDSEIGGQLSTLKSSDSNYMSLGLYRKFLDKVALIKRYGVTISSIDQIARLVSKEYTITWNADHDLVITFEESIGYKNIWVLTQLFYKLAVQPQVLIASAGGE